MRIYFDLFTLALTHTRSDVTSNFPRRIGGECQPSAPFVRGCGGKKGLGQQTFEGKEFSEYQHLPKLEGWN